MLSCLGGELMFQTGPKRVSGVNQQLDSCLGHVSFTRLNGLPLKYVVKLGLLI